VEKLAGFAIKFTVQLYTSRNKWTWANQWKLKSS